MNQKESLPVTSALSNFVSGKIKSITTKKMRWLSVICAGVLMSSCSITPGLEDNGQPNYTLQKTAGIARLSVAQALPSTVTFNKVELYLSKSRLATGFITVLLRDSANTYTLDSAFISLDSIKPGLAWNTIRFPSSATLQRKKTYRLYVKRSERHNPTGNNTLYWMTSTKGIDAYPDSYNDLSSSSLLDYCFRTYTNGGLDQQQSKLGNGYYTTNTFYRWQEFEADLPKVNLTSIDLNLQVGSATTGRLYVAIQYGIDTLAKISVPASSLPSGTNWVTLPMNAMLYRGQKYDIFVHRSDAHNPGANNYILWMSSLDGTDAYPDGTNDQYPSSTLDYAFKTYTRGELDQQQLLNQQGFSVGRDSYRWQQFIPRLQ